MNYSLAFLGLAILFGGMLAWGLKSGSMPAKPFALGRVEYPRLYWIQAVLLGIFAFGCLAASIHQSLQGK